jgi:hypothetical protein
MDELNSLPYFDAVTKESLRLCPSFENTLRVAQSDDVVPLEKPFVDRNGRLQDRIKWVPNEALCIVGMTSLLRIVIESRKGTVFSFRFL